MCACTHFYVNMYADTFDICIYIRIECLRIVVILFVTFIPIVPQWF